MTVYFNRVMGDLLNRYLIYSSGYKHFRSTLPDFWSDYVTLYLASINNHYIDIDRLPSDWRLTRFMRDPRDLVVSGYFYHRKGAEKWCNIRNPSSTEWEVVNGSIPEGLRHGQSYADHLAGLSIEDGLIAEIQFRKYHFESMLMWPENEPRIKTFKYENILGREKETFALIFKHYGMRPHERALGCMLADKFSVKKRMNRLRSIKHIRNPSPGQWREHFTPKVSQYFNERYGDLVSRYGYDA